MACVGAKVWSREVENAYRFQCAGWRSMEEYEGSVRPSPRPSPPPSELEARASPSSAVSPIIAAAPPAQQYEIDHWSDLGLVSKLQTKSNGYFMYFKRNRECLDKYLPRVKIFEYARDAEEGKDNHK